jgi:hypothetical protein
MWIAASFHCLVHDLRFFFLLCHGLIDKLLVNQEGGDHSVDVCQVEDGILEQACQLRQSVVPYGQTFANTSYTLKVSVQGNKNLKYSKTGHLLTPPFLNY